MSNREYTYLASDWTTRAAAGTALSELDLGLDNDEIARITGVTLGIQPSEDHTVGVMAQLALSFDIDDIIVDGDDNEQFAVLIATFSAVGTSYGYQEAANMFYDFSNMNLVTAEKLLLILTINATVTVFGWTKVYYERLKPTANELVQAISRRRG